MKRNLKRLAMALFLSAGGFLATVVWFESGRTVASTADRSPIARLNESNNDVQRKPLKRVIWESVTKNDDLYPGEAIRTAENAEAKIQLVKSGAVIHLEPNSLVVLEENENGMSLDFLQGNMFVSSTNADSGLTLKTGSGEVKLNSADMSLSRDQSGKVDLAVFKGQAELQQGGKTIGLDKDRSASLTDQGLSVDKDRVQILWPMAGETVLLNLARGEKLEVAFKPLPAGYRVSAEWGRARGTLKPADVVSEGETGKISVPGKSGKGFVRLTAKSDNPALPTLASNIIPVSIDPKSPPALVEPTGEAPVVKAKQEEPVAFRWLNRHELQSQILEVATDPQFKNIKARQDLDGVVDKKDVVLGDGNYFWRVTGFLKVKDKTEALSSPVAKFAVVSTWELKAPTPINPELNQRLSFTDVQKSGINFKWSNPTGVERFAILVQRRDATGTQTVMEKEIATNVVRFSDIKPGNYQWKISSLDPKSGAPKASAVMGFVVDELPKLEWVESPSVYQYPTATPSLRAGWNAFAGANSYRFRVQNKDLAGEGEWKSAKLNAFDTSLPTEGDYVASVEALDAKGHVIARGEPRDFTVQRLPLLPAPRWAQNAPDIFKTDAKGNLSFAWEQVDGAKHYLMLLENDAGKVVEKKEISRTTASVSRLKPGQYKVRLKSVDGLQRASESASKELVVPSLSDIRAPKIKNMKVK